MTRSFGAVICGMTRLQGWSMARVVASILVLAFAVLCASCGGSPPSAERHSTTTTSDQPSTSTTTGSSQTAAILAAYRAAQGAFDRAIQKADAGLPALAATMTGGQLDSVRRALVADKENGIVGRGTVQVSPKLISIKGTTAVVHDCAFSSLELVYKRSGKPVPPATPPEHDGVSSTLLETSPGTWKVSAEHVTEGGLSRRLLSIVTAAMIGTVLVVWQSPAWASDGEGQRDNTSASATASGGTITVAAGDDSWTPPAGSPWAQLSEGDPARSPSQPYGCTYQVPSAQIQQSLGTGGATPGQWVFVSCAGPGAIDPMPAIWLTNANSPAAVNPAILAREAFAKLPLASPSIRMAPPVTSEQLVNVSSWLWIAPTDWRSLSATAAAGQVTTTATATPADVVWNMGDGNTVTCAGPGTPYDPSQPSATTDCSYTWSQSSGSQPGGVYEVTVTVYWRVTWRAAGAKGGGNLGLVPGPSAHAAVRVAESQAINNPPDN